MAAALLLEHVPQAVSILLRPGALNALVDAALDEAASTVSDATLGEPMPRLISGVLQRCLQSQRQRLRMPPRGLSPA